MMMPGLKEMPLWHIQKSNSLQPLSTKAMLTVLGESQVLSTHNLNVSFTGNKTNGKPIKSYISGNVNLRDYLQERVIFGFSAATGFMFEMNTLLS